MTNIKNKHKSIRLSLLLLTCLFLVSCGKNVPISYDENKDLHSQAVDIIDGQLPVYEPQPDRKLVQTITFRAGGTGNYVEHQIYDFGNLNVNLSANEKILISLPQEADQTWTIAQNPFKTTSKPFKALSVDAKPVGLNRVNFLMEVTQDVGLIMTLVDSYGNELYHLRLNITGTGQGGLEDTSAS